RGHCCRLHGGRRTSVIHNDAEHLQRLLQNAILLPNQKTPMHHRSAAKFKNSKILHTDTKVDRATMLSFVAGCRVQSLVRPSTPCNPFWSDASTVRFASRRRGDCTVSGPHAPPQPGSAAPRQLHSIARLTRIIEGYFCPPGSQSSTAAEDHWVPRTQHNTNASHLSGILRTCVA
ncbi:hypothetical protein TcG_11960, partial [Trypanosoma cruzi]